MGVTSPRGLREALARLARGSGPKASTGPDNHKSRSIGGLLASRMQKAKRNGSWFRLSTLERGLYSLAISIKARFESLSLVRAIVSVLKKLKEFSDPLYIFFLRGIEMAAAFADAATAYGHTGAASWKRDKAYATFLGRFLTSATRYL